MTLGKAYDEVMERIEVTPEMRRRVLERIAREDISPAPAKVVSLSALRRRLSIAACFVLLLAGAAALPRLLEHTAEPEPPVLTVPNIVEAASLQELSGLVGFEVTESFSLPFRAEKTAYRAYWSEMAEVEYSGGGCTATYRQSPGTDDNSGDYNVYGDIRTITVDGTAVTLKGDGGTYVLALWTDGTYAGSLSLSPGAEEGVWRSILEP